MSIDIGIIGLPQSGKTTVFNAFTGGASDSPRRTSDAQAANIGIVKVPDSRLKILSDMFKPKKTVPIEIKFVDIGAGLKGGKETKGFSGELLTHLNNVETLVGVVRTFEDDRIPHPEGSVDVRRDIATLEMELAFSDLAIIERRLEKIEGSLKAAKAGERPAILKEQETMLKFKESLEQEKPLRDTETDAAEEKIFANFQFLSAKPLLIVLNIGEDQLGNAEATEKEYSKGSSLSKCRLAAICGKLEAELAAMTQEEAREFREDYGLKESGLERAIRLSYELSDMISFFTVGPDECRAWPIKRNTPAVKAAGKIHTDMEKGFIRAENISYEDLIASGSLAEGKKRGLLRLEGKDYIVKDGDILSILFNV
jgi:ribosome-binding ATPase